VNHFKRFLWKLFLKNLQGKLGLNDVSEWVASQPDTHRLTKRALCEHDIEHIE